MSIWELPKDHYNWESPITKIYGDIHNEIVRQDEENCTFAIEQAIGYKVDKEELIKALQYDREQYDKGYKDGVRETFIEELEKIWDEIRALPDINPDYPMDKTIHISRYGVQEIIYKHIAELKGENKKECSTCKSDNSLKNCLGCIEYGHWELKGDNKQSKCNNCQNNTDELSGECYECVKGIEDWYEPIEENEERYITAEEYMKTGKWIGE